MPDELPPSTGRRPDSLLAAECVECGRMSAGQGRGWGVYRLDIPGEGEPPEIAS